MPRVYVRYTLGGVRRGSDGALYDALGAGPRHSGGLHLPGAPNRVSHRWRRVLTDGNDGMSFVCATTLRYASAEVPELRARGVHERFPACDQSDLWHVRAARGCGRPVRCGPLVGGRSPPGERDEGEAVAISAGCSACCRGAGPRLDASTSHGYPAWRGSRRVSRLAFVVRLEE